jgi:hypothetical protein
MKEHGWISVKRNTRKMRNVDKIFVGKPERVQLEYLGVDEIIFFKLYIK